MPQQVPVRVIDLDVEASDATANAAFVMIERADYEASKRYAVNKLAQRVPVPDTPVSTGLVGQWAASSTFFYVCVATNTWRRVALASW